MLTANDVDVIEKTVTKIVKEQLKAELNPIKKELKSLNEFAVGATDTLYNILDELQKIHDQKLDGRLKKLESIHPYNQHPAIA